MFISTSESYEVKDYPYGRLRTSMFFSVEFKDGKGFRSVRQSINPKTGRINKPKKSTYSDFVLLDVTDGFASFKHYSFYKSEEFNGLAHLLGNNFDLFTLEQQQYIYRKVITYLKLTMYTMANYCNSQVEEMIPIVEPVLDLAVKGLKDGSNTLLDMDLDHEALESTKEEGYSPFRVTYHQ